MSVCVCSILIALCQLAHFKNRHRNRACVYLYFCLFVADLLFTFFFISFSYKACVCAYIYCLYVIHIVDGNKSITFPKKKIKLF